MIMGNTVVLSDKAALLTGASKRVMAEKGFFG